MVHESIIYFYLIQHLLQILYTYHTYYTHIQVATVLLCIKKLYILYLY